MGVWAVRCTSAFPAPAAAPQGHRAYHLVVPQRLAIVGAPRSSFGIGLVAFERVHEGAAGWVERYPALIPTLEAFRAEHERIIVPIRNGFIEP